MQHSRNRRAAEQAADRLHLRFRLGAVGKGGIVAEAEAEVKAQGGRLLLRYSGTEPKARLLIEGRDKAVLEKWSQKIIGAIQKQIGK